MEQVKHQLLAGKFEKPIGIDLYWEPSTKLLPILIFAHGFKGFKDWGHWEVLGQEFAKAGFCFIKFNFSHNGTTPEAWSDFADLEAFGQNNYSKELSDLETVIQWIQTAEDWQQKTNWEAQNISLIGHSRGGPIVLITALEQAAVQRVITWAGVHELSYVWERQPELLPIWEQEGVYTVHNGRTKQDMPIYYQLYQDYQANKDRFSIKQTLSKLEKPYLILHGTEDPAVPSQAAEYLQAHAQQASLTWIEGANHVFGGQHPFNKATLPAHSQQLLEHSLAFLKQR